MIGPQIADLRLEDIRLDGGTQFRQLDEEWVEELMEVAPDFKDRPVVFREGRANWLAAGFHRAEATRRRGFKILRVDLYQGTLRDARLFAIRDNFTHGKRLTAEETETAFRMAFADPELAQLSNYALAERIGCSEKTVRNYRDRLACRASTERPQMREVGRGSQRYEMDVSKLTRKALESLPEAERVQVLQEADAAIAKAEPEPRPTRRKDRESRTVSVALELERELVERIDARAGKGGREKWIVEAIKAAL